MNVSLEVVKRWGVKGGLGILDQAIFSGANFLVSVFLARWLSNEDFGEFAIGFAVLSFFLQIYTSFSLEPMSVLGPSHYHDRLGSYLLAQVKLLFLLSVPTGMLLGFIILMDYFISRNVTALWVLVTVATGLPFLLFPLLMRRIFYVLLRPGYALLGSIIYSFCLIVFFSLARQFSTLNATSSFMIILIASLLSGLTLLFVLRTEDTTSDRINLPVILIESWSFGKWLLVSGILIALATQSPIYLTGILSRVEDAGAVRILQTFIQPMMLTSTAFSALATPSIAADFAVKAYRSVQHKMRRFTLVLFGTALLYELLLVLFSDPLNQILFNGKYSLLTKYIPVWGLVPVLLSLFWGGVIVIQASQKPQAMLLISFFWALFSFVPGLIVIPAWGVGGATATFVAGFTAAFLSTWILYWRLVHRIYPFSKRLI